MPNYLEDAPILSGVELPDATGNIAAIILVGFSKGLLGNGIKPGTNISHFAAALLNVSPSYCASCLSLKKIKYKCNDLVSQEAVNHNLGVVALYAKLHALRTASIKSATTSDTGLANLAKANQISAAKMVEANSLKKAEIAGIVQGVKEEVLDALGLDENDCVFRGSPGGVRTGLRILERDAGMAVLDMFHAGRIHPKLDG